VGDNWETLIPPNFHLFRLHALALSHLHEQADSTMATVSAGVQYVKLLKIFETEVPFESFVDIPEDATDQRKTNLEFETKVESFKDMRDDIHILTLDENGFTVKQEPLSFPPEFFTQREEVEKLYFPELERIVREVCGQVDKVSFFDWRVMLPTCSISDLR